MQNSQRALLPPPPRRLGLPLKRSDVDVDEMRFTRAVRVSPFRGRTPERRSPDLRSAERRNLETRGMERRTAEPRSMWRRGGGQSNGKLGEMRGRDNASFDMSSPPRTQRRLFGTRLSPGRQDPPPRRQKPLVFCSAPPSPPRCRRRSPPARGPAVASPPRPRSRLGHRSALSVRTRIEHSAFSAESDSDSDSAYTTYTASASVQVVVSAQFGSFTQLPCYVCNDRFHRDRILGAGRTYSSLF